ncbi:unnamed protein product [Cylindrotheca closterium]|uniref:Uncharacterized protein n=1 Tax=Cylindrotheca closterium TaxID=2856 RepID=A0AAD2G772_9STRA|nr:unnamed protein product [Cylindrotheca closterium]
MSSAAAASSRNRNHHRSGRSNANTPDVSKGLLVSRRVPTPQRSTKNSNSNSSSNSSSSRSRSNGSNSKNSKKHKKGSRKQLPARQKSFRQRMSDSMQQWKSVPSLKVDMDDEKSHASRQSSSSSSKANNKKQRIIDIHQEAIKGSNNSKAGFRRFLSRGSSSRTDDTFESLATISDRLNPGPPPPLSACFPPSLRTERYLIRRPVAKGEMATIENQHGTIVAVVEETHYGRRLLKTADGKVCAMILQHQEKYGPITYSICGSSPIVYKQSIKFDQVGLGYYKWADVQNAGGMGGTISLKHVKDEIIPKDHTFCTKMFGSVFRLKKTRGHVVLDEDKKECAKLIALPNTGRAVQIAPKHDVAMMLCYSVIVDEILENRLR